MRHEVRTGRSALAGTYDRERFKTALIPDVMTRSGGSFRETVLDVFANERGGVVHAEHSMTRAGKPFTYRTLHIYEFRDGKFASFREVPEDMYAFDEAWS